MMIEPANDVSVNSNNTSPSSLLLKSNPNSRGKKNSSASSHGSGRSHREEPSHRDTSSSSDQSDLEELNNVKPKRKTQKRRPAFSAEEDDDERTDSADEGIEEDTKESLPNSTTSYFNQFSSSSFNQSGGGILRPLSPISLNVGYGSDLVQQSQTTASSNSTSVINSIVNNDDEEEEVEEKEEREEEGRIESPPERSIGVPSPERMDAHTISTEQDTRPLTLSSSTLPPKPVTIATGGTNPVLPSPSLPPPTTNTALPFAGWGWGQPTAALYSPFCTTATGAGSVATTPAIGDGLTPFLPPGTTTYLQAVICQELEGVLVVNIHWRNKTYSGSLIDLQHHEWAPPRLVEDVPDLSIKLKDIFSKKQQQKQQENEKDTAIDVVEVMEDNKESNANEQDIAVAMETNNETEQDVKSSVEGNTDTNIEIDKNKIIDHTPLLKPPNGLQVPSIVAPPTTGDKPNKTTPFLPPFDAVKSPQPQLANNNKERRNIKNKEAPPTTTFPRTSSTNSVIVANSGEGENKMADHHNFNTLVDVAASMTPVHDEKSSDDTLSDKDSTTGVLKSTLTYRPLDGHTHHHGNGEDSDSSGSGSLSPIKKKTPSHRKKRGSGEPYIVKETIVKDEGGRTQPDTPSSFSAVPFAFSLIPPISPGESHLPSSSSSSSLVSTSTNSNNTNRDLIQPPKVMKPNQFWSPVGNSSIGKELDSRFPPNVDATNPPAHLVPSLIAYQEGGGAYPSSSGHMISTPPQTVIQDRNNKIMGRKRKMVGGVVEDSKRLPPSPKDNEILSRNKPIPPLPSSFTHVGGAVGVPSHLDPSIILQQQISETSNKLPDGFIYEPSMPMSKELQLLAFQREKEMEKMKGVGSSKKRSRDNLAIEHRHTSPSPPSSAFNKRGHAPMGVVVSDHMMSRHVVGGVMTHPQIKQEPLQPPNNRPPSKGHHHSSSNNNTIHKGQTLSSSSAQQDKKRSSRPKPDPVPIKKEPDQQIQWSPAHFAPISLHVPPGSVPPTVLNLPPGLAMPISSSPSQLPHNFTPIVGGAPGQQYGIHLLPSAGPTLPPPPTKPKSDSAHSTRHRQTPSPNPKKVHDWAGHSHGHAHVITPTPTKPEHGSRHGNPVDSKSHLVRMPPPPHQSSLTPSLLPPPPSSHSSSSSSNSNRHKMESSSVTNSSSRHSHSSHTHPSSQPSPTHQGIRNGGISGPEEMMKMQMLQLEAIKSSQDLMAYQARVSQLMGGGTPVTGVPLDQATIQMQLAAIQQQQMAAAVQQQQQQQQNEAAFAANFQALAAAQGVHTVIPFMQSFPLATAPTGIPFALHPPPPPPKRDS